MSNGWRVGFEIVDSHYPDWRFTASEAVADFGVHAALVVGTPWCVDSDDPEHLAASLRDAPKSRFAAARTSWPRGMGCNALGSPLRAVGFLARVLAAQSWAPPLMPGEVITTGTLTALPCLRQGIVLRRGHGGAPRANCNWIWGRLSD